MNHLRVIFHFQNEKLQKLPLQVDSNGGLYGSALYKTNRKTFLLPTFIPFSLFFLSPLTLSIKPAKI